MLAVTATAQDSSLESGSPSPAGSTGQIPLAQQGQEQQRQQPAPKLKGRHKLLQSLQRMSSTPALTRRSRSASTGYRRDGKASLSCVSLTSSSAAYQPCWGNGSSSQLYGGLAGPHLSSGAASPAADLSDGISPRIRLVRPDTPNAASLARTVPMPLDRRPASRGAIVNEAVAVVVAAAAARTPKPQRRIDFWGEMPHELQMRILCYLPPREIVRCSAVSHAWRKMCYDGQLWGTIDTTDYYRDISGEALVKLITAGGPFVRDLNLRGCVQLQDWWQADGEHISDVCRNVVNFSLEGCAIDKTSIHCFLLRNSRLKSVNLSGLLGVTNAAMKILAQSCPQLETLNVSWCAKVDTRGLRKIVEACPRLQDLGASEIRGFDDEKFMIELFERNTLQRLDLSRSDVTDDSLRALVLGLDPEIDLLTDRPIVAPRRLTHLDVHQCLDLTDRGLATLAFNVPEIESLQLSQCPGLTDDSIIDVLRTTPLLTRLDLEDLDRLTNTTLIELARAPCAATLQHLNISYCESLSDIGMLPVFKSCPRLQYVEMDNTRVSDLSLMEACSRVRKRGYGDGLPRVGLHLVIFDCANVTWAGVKGVLSSNALIPRSRRNLSVAAAAEETTASGTATSSSTATPLTTTPPTPSSTPPLPAPTYPNEIIQLKCFYAWQVTVDEHTRRVLRGDLRAASRLDRKWADLMMATEEAGTGGVGARRRRRRAREAERLYNADDDDGDDVYAGTVSPVTGRRRAQSGGCSIM
ncbi:hypothetical protein ASPZODRAFT_2106702 [Penicilliopsis zonata CBS 506.65]|uniref:F-box domain-containing protein n=1 Tax=Penicilliopsis zonata CBS 506.65 TaxID=1073090 RepID=A0A1L9SW13_9EURO|nr:hypothetical protein ASPZODRAFT_2106702 [Penicilliopsis zonata CBS 506.65]OJJ51324.1 hypothetical protein ASPZODRAFT_2106702 [Penicilliopsis zonata CBS 506.65]